MHLSFGQVKNVFEINEIALVVELGLEHWCVHLPVQCKVYAHLTKDRQTTTASKQVVVG